MSLRYFANAPATTLAVSCNDTQTSIELTNVAGLPIQYPYTLILDRGTGTEEAVSVTNAAGTVLTVDRGYDSTTAAAHSLGATVEHGITAQDIREPNSHINASSGVHGATGSVVGTTDAQALTNKDLSGAGNTFPTSLATLTGSQALTNKTIGNTNTINGFTASRFMEADGTGKIASGSKAIPAGAVVGTTDTQTLTNKDLTGATNSFPSTLAKNVDVQTFTADGTWTKPTGAKFVQILLIGGGGGGGGGRRGATSTTRIGGNGGAAGAIVQYGFPATDLSASELVTVGFGGAGPSGQFVDNTNGSNGAVGGSTSISIGSGLLWANGGGGGPGGTNVPGSKTSAGAGTITTGDGGTGGGGNTGGTTATAGGIEGGGGGGGGGITSGNVTESPAVGSQALWVAGTLPHTLGRGGNGGAINTAGNNATNYGAGGGGGGASTNGTASGGGGDGAPGLAVIITYF